ncbi:hypothetical protein Hanom_Chr07g00606871 [Helianthus anomalus]
MIKIETSKRSRIHLLHIAMRSPKFRIKTIEPANNPTARSSFCNRTGNRIR